MIQAYEAAFVRDDATLGNSRLNSTRKDKAHASVDGCGGSMQQQRCLVSALYCFITNGSSRRRGVSHAKVAAPVAAPLSGRAWCPSNI